MGKRLGAALDELRTAFFEAYAALAEEGAKTGTAAARKFAAIHRRDPGVAPAGRIFGHASRIARNSPLAAGDWRAAMCPRGHGCQVFDKDGPDPFEKSRQRL